MAARCAVLFDLDGTLIDTAPDFHACLNATLQALGEPPQPFARVREVVSDGARALLRLALAEDDPRFEGALAGLLERYTHAIAAHSRLFPGLERLLAGLESRGIPWGLVTNKPQRFSEPLLAALDLHNRCKVLVCPDHVRQRKPDPEGILLACRQLGCDPAQSFYIGDHERDIEAGRRAGCITVACRYGYLGTNPAPERWGADLIADSGDELADLLLARLSPETEENLHHV